MKTAVSPTWWQDQRWQGWLRLLQGVLEIQSFNIPRYKTDLQNVGKRSKDPFHVLPEGRKTEPGASGRRRNASLCPAEGRSLPGATEKRWGKPTSAQAAAEAQRSASPSLKCSSGAQSAPAKEHSAAPHRLPRGLVLRLEQHSIPEPYSKPCRCWGRQHSSSRRAGEDPSPAG